MSKDLLLTKLYEFQNAEIFTGAKSILNSIGYDSDRILQNESSDYQSIKKLFKNSFDYELRDEKCSSNSWLEFQILFQFTPEETNDLFSNNSSELKKIDSFLFLALDLKNEFYTRTELSSITRELNRAFPMPAILIFRFGKKEEKHCTISVIDRRKSRTRIEANKDKSVLEKITHIHNINLKNPHRAHLEILSELDFKSLNQKKQINTFVELYESIQTVLDIKELNKKFYKDISNWYFWAMQNVTFPYEVPYEKRKNQRFTFNFIDSILN